MHNLIPQSETQLNEILTLLNGDKAGEYHVLVENATWQRSHPVHVVSVVKAKGDTERTLYVYFSTAHEAMNLAAMLNAMIKGEI